MIYLIRHGETAANLRHLYCGSTDLPLSEQGMAKLHRQKDFSISKTRFITSGMLRTEQTLNLLVERYSENGVLFNQEAMNNGLLLESAGTYGNVIRFLCPLCVTDAQLEAGLKIFKAALDTCLAK